MTTPHDAKIVFAPQDEVEQLQPQINALLAILGHPEAWVSDESGLIDFFSPLEFPTLEAAQEELDRLAKGADITVQLGVTETLVSACRAILQDNPNWPGSRSIQ